ncbi:MAG TPA: GAF domain-containing sensor histidine kinase [Gemmatimonadales bacterium]
MPEQRLQRARAKEKRRVEERFRRLMTASLAIFSHQSLDDVLQEIVDTARQVVGARYAALGVLAPDHRSLAAFVTSGLSAAARARIGPEPSGRGLLGYVIRARKPVRTADIARHPQRYGFPPHHPPMKSFLGVPIATGGAVFGNLYLTEKIGAAEFSAEDMAIAVLLAAQAAAAIENARLFESGEQLLGQVRALQRQRELFFAMMNHELRNALTGVFGWADRLVRAKSPEKSAEAAREVYESTERTITLLNNFLDLSRLDAGKLQPVWREVDLGAALRRALTGFEPAAETKRLALMEDIPAACPAIITDPVRLEQILVNLLSNAVRHSPPGGEIRVEVRPNTSMVEFLVRDQGPGIPADVQERIFEPFERFDPLSGEGTGLGLPVSRRLAEVLGGRLEVQNATEHGAVFTLTLPVRPES